MQYGERLGSGTDPGRAEPSIGLIQTESVAAVSSHVIQVAERALDALGRSAFEQFTMTSAHGRMVFVNLGVGYLVVITKMEMRLEQVAIEVESAARKIRGMGKRI